LDLALELLKNHGQRFVAHELIRFHPSALSLVHFAWAEQLAAGMSSWDEVDMFATLIAGQAWRRQQITLGRVLIWAGSRNRWWRRAALVSTVPLNVKSQAAVAILSRR
jgi:3-methyladenine DNA glycosylase AlkD